MTILVVLCPTVIAVAASLGDVLLRRRRRANACARLLVDTAALLGVRVTGLAECLGTSRDCIERWAFCGVPSARQVDVHLLARQAIALRRQMSAPRVVRLLELQRRGADSVATAMRQLVECEDARRRFVVRGVTVTSR